MDGSASDWFEEADQAPAAAAEEQEGALPAPPAEEQPDYGMEVAPGAVRAMHAVLAAGLTCAFLYVGYQYARSGSADYLMTLGATAIFGALILPWLLTIGLGNVFRLRGSGRGWMRGVAFGALGGLFVGLIWSALFLFLGMRLISAVVDLGDSGRGALILAGCALAPIGSVVGFYVGGKPVMQAER